MTEAERMEQTYRGVLFPEFGKGGYTFFKRIIKQSIQSGEPVYFNTGKLVYKYEFKDGQQSFLDGATKMEGDDPHAEEAVESINKTYRLELGLQEIRSELKGGETKGWFGKWR